MSEINQNIPDSNVVSGVETITKKRKAPIIAGVTAGVVAVGAGGGVIAYNTSDFVKNQVKLATLSPSEYYSWVHEDGVNKFAKDISDDYKSLADMLGGKAKESYLSDCSLTFTAGEDAKSALKEYIGDDADEFEDIIDNFNSVKFNINSANDTTNSSANASLSLNDESLISVESLFDAENLEAFIRMPELSEKYLGFEFGSLIEDSLDEESTEASEIFSEMSYRLKDLESVLSADELADLITRYSNVWFDSVSDVELEKKEEVEIGDITTKYTTLTVDIDGDFLYDVVTNYADEITNDKLIKKIACDRLEICDEDDYDELMDQISEAIDDENFKDSFDNIGFEGEYITYVDAKGVIRGISLSLEGEEEDQNIDATYLIGKEDDKVCGILSLDVDGESIIDGELNADVDKNDAYTGEISLVLNDEEDTEFSVEFDEFKVVDKEKSYVSGDVTLNIPDLDPLTFNLESDGKSQVIGFDININDMEIGSLELEYSIDKNKNSIEMPSEDEVFFVDLNGDFDYTDYVSDDEISAFVSELCKKIGLDEETAEEMAESASESIDDAINGGDYDDYGYNDWDYDDDYSWDDDYDWDDSDYNWDDEEDYSEFPDYDTFVPDEAEGNSENSAIEFPDYDTFDPNEDLSIVSDPTKAPKEN